MRKERSQAGTGLAIRENERTKEERYVPRLRSATPCCYHLPNQASGPSYARHHPTKGKPPNDKRYLKRIAIAVGPRVANVPRHDNNYPRITGRIILVTCRANLPEFRVPAQAAGESVSFAIAIDHLRENRMQLPRKHCR